MGGRKPAGDKVIIESLRPDQGWRELTYNYGITLEEPHTARMKKNLGLSLWLTPTAPAPCCSLRRKA